MLHLHYFNILNDHFLCLNMNYVIRESQISERWPKTPYRWPNRLENPGGKLNICVHIYKTSHLYQLQICLVCQDVSLPVCPSMSH